MIKSTSIDKNKTKKSDFTFLLNLAMSELGLHLSIYLIHLPRGLNAVYKYSVSGGSSIGT